MMNAEGGPIWVIFTNPAVFVPNTFRPAHDDDVLMLWGWMMYFQSRFIGGRKVAAQAGAFVEVSDFVGEQAGIHNFGKYL